LGTRDTINKLTPRSASLSDGSPGVKTENKYVPSHYTEQNHKIMAQFQYVGITVTNCINERMKGRLNMENACYHSSKAFVFPLAI